MASGSPRARIDQYYASKKRKNLSPGLKPRGVDKEEKRTARASPSSKGTLDNYLRSSQGNDLAGEGLFSARDLSAREDSVKRNLVEEIEKSERLESTPLQLPSQEHHQHAAEAAHEPPDSCRLHTSMAEGPAEVHASVESGNGNSELKQFANDFLSLYCSEIQSNIPPELKAHQKRHGSPSIFEEETLKSNKRHQKVFSTQPDDAGGNNVKEICPSSSSNCIRQVSAAKDPNGPEEILKRCNETPISVRDTIRGFTPGSSIVKSLANGTPRSACGSSMFSPGEAFWSEAIKLADGISAPANNSVCQHAELFSNLQRSSDLGVLDDLRKKDGDGMREGVLEGQSSISLRENDAAEGVERKNEHLDRRVSRLPVKHFDFSCEDKNIDEVTPCICDVDNAKVTYGYLKQNDRASVGLKGVQGTSILAPCGQVWKTEGNGEKEKMVVVCAMTEQNAALLSQKFDSNTSDSPNSEVKSFTEKKDADVSLTPSTSLKYRDHLDITSWLPSEICHVYRKKGISKLYPWQVDCLQVDGVLQRKNLVYCASTSAGKSFVAEILMLHRVLLTAKIALLVLPYVSICTEKAEHLEVLLQPLGKHVRSYYGNQGGGALPKDTSVAVCTIEKANSLINRLLEEGRLSEIGITVIDELHMVGDQSRGYLLELMLTKLRYAAGEGNAESSSSDSSSANSGKTDIAHGLQIVGMSATMPNVAAVADWLQAALYQTDFRPVPLEEYIKVGSTIYNKSMEIVRSMPKVADLGGKDPDHIVELCNEVVQEGHSVLIFCSSRKGCESTARHVSRFLKSFSVNLPNNDNEFTDIASAIDALRRCPAGLDPILEETLPFGVAYHHAGLTVEEREVVELCYRKGLVRVLTATSTLAAGVNLPARRVIFRQPRIGRDFIDGTRYKQMAGRAGRTGIDTKGESILICRPEEIKRIVGLLNENCPPLNSCLSEDKNGMTHAILEVVAGGIVQTAQDINRYVRCTLLNSTKPFQEVVKSAQDSLRWLCHRRFLEWNEDTKLYSTTPLGRAAFGSSLSPEESLIVLEDLSRAREGFVLASDLHLVYLVTPTNVDVEPDWELYYQRFMELSSLDQSVGNRVGVGEPFLMRMAHGAPVHSSCKTGNSKKGVHAKFQKYSSITNKCSISDDQTLRVCKRFYVALILSRLVQEIPVVEVCEAFKVSRGMVQSLQENAGRFASMVSVFCERLGWSDLEGLVSKFQNRVSFGVRAEIVELTNIPYVKGSRARALYKAGLRTPLAIAEASVSELVKALFESSSWVAEESSAQRRMQLGVAKKIKNGARKIVFEKAEEARVAAFSAFQSLGLDITQFSRSALPNVAANPTVKGSTEISSEEGSTPSSNGARYLELVSTEALTEANAGFNVVEEDEKVRKALVGGSVPSDAANTSAVATPDVGVRKIELKVLTCHEENEGVAPLILLNKSYHLHKADDGKKIADGYHDNNPQINLTENVQSQNKERGLNKGPVYSVNTTGGFDSFLDLWDSVEEFYFDMHYSKRRQGNSVALFEMHGLAICWGNSPVYYINLPKDLFWREKNKNSFSSRGASSEASYDFPPDNLVDMFKLRWNKIGEILGKIAVRKFTWNLKCQIQVLKNSIASLQKTGCPNLAGKHRGIELVDNSYLMLPPIDIKGGVDMSIVAWILWPDEERSSNPNLEKGKEFLLDTEMKKRLSLELSSTNDASYDSMTNLLLEHITQDHDETSDCIKSNLFFEGNAGRPEEVDVWLTQVEPFVIVYEIPRVFMEVKRRLSREDAAAAHRCGMWKNQMRKAAYDGCCRRVAQTRALCSVLWKLLIHENLLEALMAIELPLVNVLADMELWGIGVDMEGCLEARTVLGKKLRHLEKEAHSLAGLKFSLYNTADIANVLYGHLKLPIPEMGGKGKQHPSTDKHCLDLLRNEHPITAVIKEHRTLAKLLNSTLGSICSLGKLSLRTQKYTLHGHWLQTSTATGRISMEEPNLQCVEHMIEFKIDKEHNGGDTSDDHYKINARDFIVPTEENWLILTADYSQIELRLMAHFSEDSTLIGLLSKPDRDVFMMVAAKWTGKAEHSISPHERDQTKRMIYGILYGMGAKALAKQLGCSKEEASEKIKSFKSCFPGVASWLRGAVSYCQQKGYVETLKGRKRFLSKIKFGNDEEKLRAQRQAVNSICQGSAADIIKIAMINIHSVIVGREIESYLPLSDFQMLKGRCRIVLQVHDELVLEVDPLVTKEAARLLRMSMESAVSLRVPLHVKLEVGRSWGATEPFHVENFKGKYLASVS